MNAKAILAAVLGVGLLAAPIQAAERPNKVVKVKQLPKEIRQQIVKIFADLDIKLNENMVLAADGTCPDGYPKKGGKCVGPPADGACPDGSDPQTDPSTGEEFCRFSPSAGDTVRGGGLSEPIPVVLTW